MLRLSLVMGLLVGAAVPAFAQGRYPPPANNSGRGTADDEKACRHDAVKYCKQVLGDDFAVLNCFQQNRRRIRPACDAVLRKYGQ
ncbi:MAG: hypothetical protein AB7K64_05955 [Variibacter sp.]